jgi:hypothetical protein
MWEFIQANWLWFLVGGSFLLMFRLHGAGGCGMGHGSHGGSHQHEHESSTDTDAADQSVPRSAGSTSADPANNGPAVGTPAGHRRGHC